MSNSERLAMSDACVFCKIIEGSIPSNKIDENDDIVVIKDRVPKAPVHYLIIPRKHVPDVASLQDVDALVAGKILLMARDISHKLDGDKSFRLIANTGKGAGQSVFHVHFHFLSGKQFSDF